MRFRLINAPGIFQAYINRTLSGFINNFCVIYINDILIFSKIKKKYKRYIREILERLRQYNLFAKLKKYFFYTRKIKFLDFIVSNKGISINRQKIEII